MKKIKDWWWKFKIRLFGKKFTTTDYADGIKYTIYGLHYKGRIFFTGDNFEEIPKIRFTKLHDPNKFGEELNETKKN